MFKLKIKKSNLDLIPKSIDLDVPILLTEVEKRMEEKRRKLEFSTYLSSL